MDLDNKFIIAVLALLLLLFFIFSSILQLAKTVLMSTSSTLDATATAFSGY